MGFLKSHQLKLNWILALVIFFILRQPEAQTEIKKTKQDTRELGNDAVEGVKDAYGATKDAVQDAVK